jgi:NUMOD3 motif-containing protein
MNSIYVLLDPRTGDVRYVGVTCQGLQVRLWQHLQDARNGRQNHRCTWIRSLLALDLKPAIKLIESTDDRQRECMWIRYFDGLGDSLTNGTEGGEGTQSPTPEVREKIRKAMTGRVFTPEWCHKISAAKMGHQSRLGLSHTPETRQKMSEAHVRSKKAIAARETLRVLNIGRPCSQEKRSRISKSLMGRSAGPRSEATRQRMKEAQQRRRQRERLDDIS